MYVMYASDRSPWLRTHAEPQPDSLSVVRSLDLSAVCREALHARGKRLQSDPLLRPWAASLLQMAVLVDGGGGVCVCVCVCGLVVDAGVCVCVCVSVGC